MESFTKEHYMVIAVFTKYPNSAITESSFSVALYVTKESAKPNQIKIRTVVFYVKLFE